MSTAAADVFDHSHYQAPEAELLDKSEVVPDKLFSAKGRVGVLRYNTRVFQGLLLLFVGTVVPATLYFAQMSTAAIVTGAFGLVAIIAGLAMMIYTAIKRLHDLDYSGWFCLIAAIPLIGTIWSLYYALKPGSEEANRFGASLPATPSDKVMGVLGILLTFGLLIASIIPNG